MAAGHNPNFSDLDSNQIIQHGYEDANDQHRVKIQSIDASVVIPTVQGGLSVLGSYNVASTSISHTSSFQITAGFASTVQQILVADTTGQTDKITFGTSTIYTNPGCERQYNVQIPPSTSVSIQSAESSDPVAGSYIITFLG